MAAKQSADRLAASRKVNVNAKLHVEGAHLAICTCHAIMQGTCIFVSKPKCLPSQRGHSSWPLCPCHAGNAGHLDDCLKAKVCAIPEREFSTVGASDAPSSLWRPAERIHRGPVLQKGSGSVAGRALRHVGVPRMTLPFLGAQEHLGFFIQEDVHAQLKVT